MQKKTIDRFFVTLAKKIEHPAEVIVTGACAGILYGHIRPSRDIDFEIRFKNKNNQKFSQGLDAAIQWASEEMGVATNYGEDIGHWSMIDWLDYRKHAIPYKKINTLDIRLMAPDYWTIGKMGRFYETDIHDMMTVMQKKNMESDDLIRLWARAFRKSPISLEKRQFIQHVHTFLDRYGHKVWGKRFQPDKAIALFDSLAGLGK